MSPNRIVVLEGPRQISFSFKDMVQYNGGGSPAGVAHAFKVLERALPSLAPGGGVEPREVFIETAFGGPGARDACELVTRAVTDGRLRAKRRIHGRLVDPFDSKELVARMLAPQDRHA